MKRIYEIIIITLLFVVVCFVYKGQQRITHNDGQGFDGEYYYDISEQIQQDETAIEGNLPFIKRLGTPFLIATYSEATDTNLLDSALIVNLTGTFITVILLLFWLRLFIDTFWIRGLLCFLFMMSWFVPLRFSFFYPMSTDAWGAVWFVGALLLLHAIRKSYNNKPSKSLYGFVFAFSFVVAIGYLFRESLASLSIVPFFILSPLSNLNISKKTITISNGLLFVKKTCFLLFARKNLIFFVPVIAIVLTSVISSNLIVISVDNEYSYFRALFRWIYKKSLAEYVLGILIAYGPLLLLLPFYYEKFKSVLLERQELLVLLFLAFLFGFIGGSDTERIFFMSGFPVIFILMGIAIKSIYNSTQKWWLYVLLVLQTVALRFFWNIPDFPSEIKEMPIPFFSLIGDNFQLLYLYSHHGHYMLNSILLLEYVTLFIVTGYIIINKIDFSNFHNATKNHE